MSKNIKIIFWGHPLYDGRCMNMIDQFINQNHKVSVLGVGNKSEKLNYKSAQIELIDKTRLRNAFTKYFKFFHYVKKYIIYNKPDVIVASDLYSMIPAAQIKKNLRAKIIYDSRELYTQLAGLVNKPIIQKIWSWYEKKYISNMDYILVTAEIDRDYLKKLYNCKNIEVVKNLPGDCFINQQKANLKEILCLNENQKIFIYQGKFHAGRGVRLAIKWLKKIKDSVLVLIGDGPMKKQYLDIAKEYNMEENVFFIDAVPYDQLSIFASNAYIGLSLIQPISKSYEHALPNKLFEYAVSGLPVICSNLKAMQQFISKYKNGIAIDHANEKEFIDAYKQISTNYDDYVLNQQTRSMLLWNNQNEHLNRIINE